MVSVHKKGVIVHKKMYWAHKKLNFIYFLKNKK